MTARPRSRSRDVISAFALCVVLSCASQSAHADGTVFVHTVRPGETLASIAQRYYGDPRRESVLVAENGLTTQGGAAIVVGLRLMVPTVSYHRVAAGETWVGLAERFYGDARRAVAIMDANSGTPGTQPDDGAELLIPYPLRHVAGQHDTVSTIAQLYYGATDKVALLRRFNNIRGNRMTRGQVVLVPLADLTLSDDGRGIVSEATGTPPEVGAVRALQEQIDSQLPQLREHVRAGRYTEAVSLANRLLGGGELTGNQVVTIQRELATAYVALDRTDLAIGAARAALERQPDFEPDSIRTSPRVLEAFRRAREHGAAAGRDGQPSTPSADPRDAGAP